MAAMWSGRKICLILAAILSIALQAAFAKECPAAFSGPNCRTPKNIPCIGSAFEYWVTLSQYALKGESGGVQYSCKGNTKGCLAIGGKGGVPTKIVTKMAPYPFYGSTDLPVRSCALVGNSPILKKKKAGPEIDTHDIVLRFNNAPTKRFENSVGRKTTLRWTNQRWSGYREKGHEAVISKFCTPDAKVKADRDCSWGKKQVGFMLNKKVHPMNPKFDTWSEAPFRKKGATPSSGFKMLLILLHVCQKVDVYGLGGNSNYRQWYWNKYPGFKGKPPVNKLPSKKVDKNWTVKQWKFATPTDLPKPAPALARKEEAHSSSVRVSRRDGSDTVNAEEPEGDPDEAEVGADPGEDNDTGEGAEEAEAPSTAASGVKPKQAGETVKEVKEDGVVTKRAERVMDRQERRSASSSAGDKSGSSSSKITVERRSHSSPSSSSGEKPKAGGDGSSRRARSSSGSASAGASRRTSSSSSSSSSGGGSSSGHVRDGLAREMLGGGPARKAGRDRAPVRRLREVLPVLKASSGLKGGHAVTPAAARRLLASSPSLQELLEDVEGGGEGGGLGPVRRLLKSGGNHNRKMEDGCLKSLQSAGMIKLKT